MKKSYILPLIASAIIATGCSKENPFDGMSSGSEGQFLKSALSVDINADGFEVRSSRADANVNDFTVIFNREGDAQPAAKYKYGEMPEIVTLPAGSYTVTATYGENRLADWDSPYFLGVSQKFAVEPYEITSYVEPIECKLENIKVTIDFDKSLRDNMTADSYVEVKVGSSTSLNYGIAEADAAKAGYFMHQDEITLVAVFHGTVGGNKITETKSMQNIIKGAHYKITFKLHQDSDSEFNGDADGDIEVDASVTVEDVNRNVSLIEDEPMDDNERPQEGENPGQGGNDSDDPNNPGTGDNPPAENAPTITADAPVNLDIVNDGYALTSCVLHINSSHEKGITGLVCDIKSPALTSDDLKDFGLDTHLDLVNTPQSMQEGLETLGLPYSVGGQNYVKFDISRFITILASVAEGYENSFELTVTDGNGSCTKILRIKF